MAKRERYHVSIPLIAVVGVFERAEPRCDVDAREDDLVADDSPHRTTVLALDQTPVEPVLLPTAHQRPRGIVGDVVDVVVVPIQSCNTPVVVARVEHDQIHHLAQLEVPPDAQIVVERHLPDRHPLEIRPHSVHLALVDAHAAKLEERLFRIVHAREAVAVAVVGDLVVVPDRDPGELLVRQEQVEIRAVLCQARSVVVERSEFSRWVSRPCVTAENSHLILVDVVAKVQNVVDVVLPSSIAIRIEVAVGEIGAGEHCQADGS